ncbi:hypothetical protein EK904_014079, partial [Melospiza melodia maxima]
PLQAACPAPMASGVRMGRPASCCRSAVMGTWTAQTAAMRGTAQHLSPAGTNFPAASALTICLPAASETGEKKN